MISTKKWVAAGSTATLLAGGLFLGAPMASAAPGDAACLQASTQFNAALSAAGLDLTFVDQFEVATAAAVVAAEDLAAVLDVAATSEAAVAADEALIQAEKAYEAAVFLVSAEQAEYDAALAAAAGNVDDATVVAAQGELTLAQAGQTRADDAMDLAVAAYDAAVFGAPGVAAAEDASALADEAVFNLLDRINVDEAAAEEILALFEAFLAACDAEAVGVEPAPVVPVGPGLTPVGPAPVVPAAPVAAPVVPVVAPVAPGAVAAPTGTNKGLNVQTAVVTEDNSAAVALIAALLAVGVAVPAVTAARMRRLERAQH